jgi:DNA-binding transcriptional MerR regulator
MDKKMTSGEIAKKMGISQKAVRLYDEKGLLKPADYSEGNYRLYDKDSILVLEKIIALKHIGFTLEEIYDNLIAGKNMDIIESLNEQLEIMEKKKQELERVIGCIKGMLARTSGQPDWNSVAELARDIMKDQQADEYHYHALKHTVEKKDWYVRIYEYLDIKKHSKVLDIGCGYGKLWRNNWSHIPNGVLVNGVDMHGSWADDFNTFIGEHKQELSQDSDITLEWGDIEEEETWVSISGKEIYDYVIAHYLIDFIGNVELFVGRVAAALKEHGIFSCNGYPVSSEHLFWERIFKDMQLKTSFISERMSKEEKLNWEFRELLLRYFERVELVSLENNMRYEDSTEVFERLCNLYPENKKYLLDNEMQIREYFERIILEDGEIIVENESQFLRCFK